MLFLIIILPLISTIILLSFSYHIGRKGAIHICLGNMFIIVFLTIWIFKQYALNNYIIQLTFEYWLHLIFLQLKWSFLFDNLTYIMLGVVSIISCLVHLYSISYMDTDPDLPRFLAYLSLFTFFMLILVTANNFLQLFLGWEGVGLCSYLLINFWYTRIQANKSALKALFVNRVGDFALLIALALINNCTQSLDYSLNFLILNYTLLSFFYFFNVKFLIVNGICFFLFIGAIGKSAQLGLHLWLPDAMEGPTPVSALIHAATMVTAGIFLIIKTAILFEATQYLLIWVILIGALTAIIASLIGLCQNDIKKIIAYSTCSQLGYMLLVCGLSNYIIALFHLTTHASFKAVLFLSAGAIIHSVGDEQDLRKYGGLQKLLPFSSIALFIGSIALMGFPFLAGFYSKDLILELVLNSFRISGLFFKWGMFIATSLTVIYSFKIFYRTFLDYVNGYKSIYKSIQQYNKYNLIIVVLGLLCMSSIFCGYFLNEIFTGIGNSFFQNSIFSKSFSNIFFENEMLPWYIKNMPMFLSAGIFIFLFIGFYCEWLKQIFFLGKFYFKIKFYLLYKFCLKKWYFDYIINQLFIIYFYFFSLTYIFLMLDRGLLEFYGPLGLTNFSLYLTNEIIKYHVMDIYKYYFYMFISLSYFIFQLSYFF